MNKKELAQTLMDVIERQAVEDPDEYINPHNLRDLLRAILDMSDDVDTSVTLDRWYNNMWGW